MLPFSHLIISSVFHWLSICWLLDWWIYWSYFRIINRRFSSSYGHEIIFGADALWMLICLLLRFLDFVNLVHYIHVEKYFMTMIFAMSLWVRTFQINWWQWYRFHFLIVVEKTKYQLGKLLKTNWTWEVFAHMHAQILWTMIKHMFSNGLQILKISLLSFMLSYRCEIVSDWDKTFDQIITNRIYSILFGTTSD